MGEGSPWVGKTFERLAGKPSLSTLTLELPPPTVCNDVVHRLQELFNLMTEALHQIRLRSGFDLENV